MTESQLLRLGTRGSPLALIQAEEVRDRLSTANPALTVEIVVIKTTGDRVQDRPLSEIGGKGLFTKEIDLALERGEIDAAAHSMKDVPTWLPEGQCLAAILPREDPRDALFANSAGSLGELPHGAVVGTTSLRRQAIVKLARPDLTVVSIRGNVETRLRKLAEGQVQATLLAVAGLKRLGQAGLLRCILEPEEMLPAVGQGAIGVTARADDEPTLANLAKISDESSFARVAAERACLDVLDGSCHTPIAGLAELSGDGASLRLRALVAWPDGRQAYHAEDSGPVEAPEALGRAVGQALRDQAGPAFFEALAGS
ncbi:MAG: hydroxymethylbilane synthase [Pseudomonadota bacterium]